MAYSKNFWLITLGVFLFMTSFNLIIPELNSFITLLDGEEYKGLIIGLFTLTAAISRPFSGKISDQLGRKSTMYIGTIVCIVVTLLYPLSGTVLFFLTLRLFHGFSTGFLPTGATAMITDILPEDRRGQGMGIFGTSMALGTGVGQVAGSPIANYFSINALFFTSSLTALITIILIRTVKETLSNPEPFSFQVFKVKRTEIFEKKVFPPAIVMFLTTICTGLVLVLTPDMTEFLKIENKGWYYIFYSISTILTRLFIGKLSDKIGRRETLIIGVVILTVSMVLTAQADTKFWFTFASFVFGLGTGIISPALFAWMADLSPNHRRGISSATIFIALEVGILLGSVSTLYLYENTMPSLRNAFIFGALMSGVALIYLLFHLFIKRTEPSGVSE